MTSLINEMSISIPTLEETVIVSEDSQPLKKKQGPRIYDERQKGYIYKSRQKHREQFNAKRLAKYHEKMKDEEWRKHRSELCRENNKKCKERKRLKLLESQALETQNI
jgi:hypothetical protein